MKRIDQIIENLSSKLSIVVITAFFSAIKEIL